MTERGPIFDAAREAAPVPWEDLRPYEQQQGGYWAYPKNAGIYGEGKVFVRVARTHGAPLKPALNNASNDD
jgi:hypothetical protein